MLGALPFPEIDPVAFQIGKFAVRWYALAYITGLIAGWRLCVWQSRRDGALFDEEVAHEVPTWVLFGMLLGGRLGYVFFYKPLYFMDNPAEIIAVWNGGMSFHGGLLGIGLAIVLLARLRDVPIPALTDAVVLVAPIGLFLGRCANFINGELYGRPTDHWIGMVFPADPDQVARHPSQLYEAFLEGVALITVLWILRATVAPRFKPGFLSGAFLIGYGVFRSTAELFREPDAHLGYLVGGLTMGQILSIPMVIAGGVVIYLTRKSEDTSTEDERD